MIVVFDSGIWVSAMEFGGTPLEAVIRAIAQDRFAVCDQIEEEVVRVLTRKFGWEAERVRADLSFYWLDALHVDLDGIVTGICRDPKDEPILECAERAEAECIVTGDRDLLSLALHRGIRIVTARYYVDARQAHDNVRQPAGLCHFQARARCAPCKSLGFVFFPATRSRIT